MPTKFCIAASDWYMTCRINSVTSTPCSSAIAIVKTPYIQINGATANSSAWNVKSTSLQRSYFVQVDEAEPIVFLSQTCVYDANGRLPMLIAQGGAKATKNKVTLINLDDEVGLRRFHESFAEDNGCVLA